MRIMNIVTLRHETYGIAEGEGVKRLHLWMIRIRILPSYSGIWIPDWSGIQVMGTGHGYSDVFVYKCAVFRSSLYLQNSKFYNIEKVTYISVFDPNSEQVRHSDPTCIVPFNKNNTCLLKWQHYWFRSQIPTAMDSGQQHTEYRPKHNKRNIHACSRM